MGRQKLPSKKQLTLEEVAAKYGVTDGATFQWKKQMITMGLPWTWEGIEKFKDIKRAQPVGELADIKKQKLQKEVERLDIKIQRERAELVLAAEVQEAFTRILSIWCSEIDALVNDLPGQIGGLSENEMLPKLKSRGEMLKRNAGQAISLLP
jgi:hypothetical protein